MKKMALAPIILVVSAASAIACSAHRDGAVAQTALKLKSDHVIPMNFDGIDDEENPYTTESADSRSVGDWITTEFASNGKPITVQQRVLSRDGAASVVEVAIKDGKKTQTFRIRTSTTRAGEQVTDVTKVDGSPDHMVEHATTMAIYEAALQKTVPNVDRNDGVVDVEPVTMDLGSQKIEAVRTTYKVVVAGKPATMSIVHSDAFAWGDIAGDIVSDSGPNRGKTLYSTRVVESGDKTRAVADLK
jgi:hypothetical protein